MNANRLLSAVSLVAAYSLFSGASTACPTDFTSATELVSDFEALPRRAIAADFNGDGFIDVAVLRNSGDVEMLRGNGNGTFQPGSVTTLIDVGSYAKDMEIADFDLDGRTDLIIVSGTPGPASVLRGRGDGTFDPPFVAVSGVSTAIAVADFNGDGHIDIVGPSIPEIGPSTFLVFWGTGAFTFNSPQQFEVFGFVGALPVGDINGDGLLDLVAGTRVFLGSPNGFFVSETPNSFGKVFADINRDGRLDLVGNGHIFLGNGDGTFQPRRDVWPPGTADVFALADFNGDGRLDAAVGDNSGTVRVLLGDGAGSFTLSSTEVALDQPRWIVAPDLNGDLKPDLFVSIYNGPVSAAVLLNTTPPPTPEITLQPQSQRLVLGQTISLSTNATGVGVQYQWYKNGVPASDTSRITGAQSALLRIVNAQVADQGDYWCIASNTCGGVQTVSAQVSCRAEIDQHPTGGTFDAGDTFTLTASIATGGSVTYRWKKDGSNLFNSPIYSGVTTSTLTVNAFDPTQSGNYSVAVTNQCGVTTSDPAVVLVICRGDFNADGFVDFTDFDLFVTAFEAGDSGGDFNADGFIDFTDFDSFVTAFEVGC